MFEDPKEILNGSVDFDNPKAYGDTLISDGLVYIKNLGLILHQNSVLISLIRFDHFKRETLPQIISMSNSQVIHNVTQIICEGTCWVHWVLVGYLLGTCWVHFERRLWRGSEVTQSSGSHLLSLPVSPH